MHVIWLMLLGLVFSINAIAEEGLDNAHQAQFDDWSCYYRSGIIPESYSVDSYANNIYADGEHSYDMLCTFDYKFNIYDIYYSLRILFPNCQFDSDNQLIMTKLVKSKDNSIISNDDYTLSFPSSSGQYSGSDINQDQNVKFTFFTDLISNDKMNINIATIGDFDIDLHGIQQGISNPYCNK